jgi:hypothetical protein
MEKVQFTGKENDEGKQEEALMLIVQEKLKYEKCVDVEIKKKEKT